MGVQLETSRLLSDYIISEYRAEKEQEGMRVDGFLALKASFISRTRLKQKIQEGRILCNGRKVAPSKRVREGDVFTVQWKKAGTSEPLPPLDIIFEDEWVTAVSKPAGVPVHPVGTKQTGTLIQGIHAHYKKKINASLINGKGEFYPRLLNRLDLFTSGCVLAAKTKEAYLRMQNIFTGRQVDKGYIAIVEGIIEQEEGVIDQPIGNDTQSEIQLKQCVTEQGLPSVTEYRVIERLNSHTLIHAQPITGRQHQIRVHFAHIGHPVWGDLIYKDENLFLTYFESGFSIQGLPPRHALHSKVMEFVHPFTKDKTAIKAPLPQDFKDIMNSVSPL
jgi:23S rRNA pseudouridine1911/1915/1917 synthase